MDSAWLCAQTDDAEATRALAARLAAHLGHGDLLVLTGDLGAGKTCFTQGLGQGLEVAERITSPTFTLVSEYEGRLPLHHLDVYRLDDLDETLDLDLPELLERGVTVIEWGERIEGALPAERATVELRFAPLTGAPAAARTEPAGAPGSAGADRGGADGAAGDGAGAAGSDGAAGDGAGAAGSGDDGTLDGMLDRRELRIELAGPAWVARREPLARDLQPWLVPC